MAYDPNSRTVIMANSNDGPCVPQSDSAMQAAGSLAKSGPGVGRKSRTFGLSRAEAARFFTAIPVLRSDPSKGIMAQDRPQDRKSS
jgi:hypothetical protein